MGGHGWWQGIENWTPTSLISLYSTSASPVRKMNTSKPCHLYTRPWLDPD